MLRIKKILALCGIAVIGFVLYTLVARQSDSKPEYIFDKNDAITLETVANSRKPLAANRSNKAGDTSAAGSSTELGTDIQAVFQNGGVTPETLRYFHYLHKRFKQSTRLEDHLKEVRQYLLTQMPTDEAEKLLHIYRDYLQCEIDLVKELNNWGMPTDTQGALELLAKTQQFRRERLGKELADALFGAEVKSKEYVVRRAQIIEDKDVYGEEKERRIAELNQDMWGDEADAVENVPKPYQRYREKLKIYEKDLNEIPDDAGRKSKIREFRQASFPEDVVQRLEEVDRKIDQEKETESGYFKAEKQIADNPDLSAEERHSALERLQNETFGDQADAFRRREAIRKGLEQLKSPSRSD